MKTKKTPKLGRAAPVQHRAYEVQYWFSHHTKKPESRGYPKTECGDRKSGGAAGALRAITQGLASKVRIIHRPTGRVLLEAFPEKIPGVNVRGVRVVKGGER